MNHSKSQIAQILREIAARPPEETGDRLLATAQMLEIEDRKERRYTEIANRGTEECLQCHGLRVYFDGSEGHVQCPRCRGWGRQLADAP